MPVAVAGLVAHGLRVSGVPVHTALAAGGERRADDRIAVAAGWPRAV
jgi:hypothetical protein